MRPAASPGPGLSPTARPLPAVAYEREAGAASSAPRSSYRPREPHKTALYRIVLEHLGTLLLQAREASQEASGYPAFVEHEFDRYLGCGLLSRGFARLKCPECGFERLVPFSCKGRLCPSCRARRAADIAAHLVDRVLPEAPYRQFVLTFPWPLRFPLAFDAPFFSRMIRAYLQTLFSWMRRRGRAMGIRGGRTGAVTFVQRFGGALNLNPHLHSLLPDGLFVPGEGQSLVFSPLPPPTDHEIAQVTRKIAARLGALARHALEGQESGFQDDEQAVLARSMGEAMVPAVSPQGLFDAMAEAQPPPRLCANIEGFCLHAARTVARGDRSGLEQLCRYGLRAPLSLERISLLPDGRVRYRLRRPWPTPAGITDLVLDPLKFLKRLCALIPYPYANLVRYHGIFANRSRDRTRLPAPPSAVSNFDPPASHAPLEPPPSDPSPPPKPRRTPWAQLLRRVLHVDALSCARCAAPMVVLAFITDPRVVKKILDHLRLPSSDPPRAQARLSRQQMEMFEEGFQEEVCDEPSSSLPRSSRGPP